MIEHFIYWHFLDQVCFVEIQLWWGVFRRIWWGKHYRTLLFTRCTPMKQSSYAWWVRVRQDNIKWDKVVLAKINWGKWSSFIHSFGVPQSIPITKKRFSVRLLIVWLILRWASFDHQLTKLQLINHIEIRGQKVRDRRGIV